MIWNRAAMTACVLVAVSVPGVLSCNKQKPSTPPTAGEPLRKHLMGILDAQRKAGLAGDIKGVRSYELPYVVEEDRAQNQRAGLAFDDPPIEEVVDAFRKQPPFFSPDQPVRLDTSGSWARLRQERKENGDPIVATGYFLLQDNKWWVVETITSFGGQPAIEEFAHLETDNYWPDHLGEYFFLPSVRIDVKPSDKPSSNTIFDWRLSFHVTNTSDQTISQLCMKRRFSSLPYCRGKSYGSVRPSGGEPLHDLKPGETIYLGDGELEKPKDPNDSVIFYAGPYASDRLRP